jgi:hypothetical protein
MESSSSLRCGFGAGSYAATGGPRGDEERVTGTATDVSATLGNASVL